MSLVSLDATRQNVDESNFDALLLAAARSSAADLPSLLAEAVSALRARSACVWLKQANTVDGCVARYPEEGVYAGLGLLDRLPMLTSQRTALFPAAEYVDLDVALWRDGEVIGLLHLTRETTQPWTLTERAVATALAERIGSMVERQIIEQQMEQALREQTESALRAFESYRTIFDASNDAIFLHDLETGAILDANRTACDVNGYTLEQLRERGTQLIGNGPAPFTEENALAYIARAAAGEPQRFEWCTYHQATGEEMWVEVGLQRVTIRGEGRLLALVRDIRERKRVEQALRASEEAYRTIFQHSSEGIWVHDVATGAQLEVNQAGCDLYGYTLEEMLALGHDALLYPGTEYTAERVAGYLAQALAGGTPRFEWLGRHKNGGEVWGEVTLRRVTISGKDRLLASVRDIRERKAAEAVLRRANEELEQRVAERTEELAGANLALEEEIAEHEYAREQLLQRTSELEGIFRALPDLYFRVDREGTVHDFRAGETSRLVVSPEVLLGKRLQDVMPADVGEQTELALRKLEQTGELVTFEYMIAVDGNLRDYEARFVPHDEQQVIIVVRDITERKQAERAGRESEERFRTLVENAHDITTIIDARGHLLYTTPAFSRILGYGTNELVGQNVFDYFHPDDAERDLPVLEAIVKQPGLVGRSQHRFRHKDGSWRYLEAFGRTFSPHTAAEGVVVNIRDVTEHKKAEEALRQSEEHFRRLIENSSDQMMIADTTGAITYVGPSVERLLGYTAEEMLGTRPNDLVHPDDVPAVMQCWRRSSHIRERFTPPRTGFGTRTAAGASLRISPKQFRPTQRTRASSQTVAM